MVIPIQLKGLEEGLVGFLPVVVLRLPQVDSHGEFRFPGQKLEGVSELVLYIGEAAWVA